MTLQISRCCKFEGYPSHYDIQLQFIAAGILPWNIIIFINVTVQTLGNCFEGICNIERPNIWGHDTFVNSVIEGPVVIFTPHLYTS